MKLIVVLGNIVTIILVTLPVFKTVRISADERNNEYLELKTVESNISRMCNCDFSPIFRDFVLDESEMYDFANYFIRTKENPDWAEARLLKNPKLYKQLRFEKKVDSVPSNVKKMNETLTNLKDFKFPNSPDVNIEQIGLDYIGNKLYKLISLENYFALRVLEKDYNQIEQENIASWRMKKALFSLAIRQYIPMDPHYFSPIYCKAKHLKPKSFIVNYKLDKYFVVDDFWLCSSKDFFPEQLSESSLNRMNDKTLYSIFYSIQINDPKHLIYLEDVIKSDNEKLYFLLPDTQFISPTVPEVYKTDDGLAAFINIKTKIMPYRQVSIWLAQAANQIERYKRKEKNDEQKFFKFLDDEEFDFLDESKV